MGHIKKISQQTVDILFAMLMILTIIGTLRIDKLLIINTTARVLLLLVILLLLLVAVSKSKKLQKYLYRLRWQIVFIWMSIIFIGQVFFVLTNHPAIGFDLNSIFNEIIYKNRSEYFGNYPNNRLLLLWQGGYLNFISKTMHIQIFQFYWLFLDILTLILVDLSVILNIFTIRTYDKKYTLVGIYVHVILLSLFPWIIVPYSDTWVLPFVSLYLMMYIKLLKDSRIVHRILYGITFGICCMIAYFLKPSAIIPVIAIALMTLIYSNKKNTKNLMVIFVIILSMVLSFEGLNFMVNNQKVYPVDTTKRIPMIHFLDMGAMSPRGGYNYPSVMKMNELKNIDERKQYSKSHLIKTLKQKGWLGYIKFLIAKQGYNSSDGTFGWLSEGNFLTDITKKGNFFEDYFYPGGKYLPDYQFLAQLTWLFILLGILCGFKDKSIFVLVLRLSIIGGYIFLLLFEGGRSRYIIQFLPVFLILFAICWEKSYEKMRNIWESITK